MKKKILGRLLTMLLIVSMTLTLLPVPAMAAYGSSSWGSWKDELRDYVNRLWNKDKEDTEDEAQIAENAATYATDNSKFRIVMLDCGRKYFSVDNIKKLIDAMAQYGYNQLQLAFGNGGLRFVLDDMSLSYGTFSEQDTNGAVKNKIKAGNESFNGDKSNLTESNMGTIISYANSKNIEIVPMLNMPGHMEGILSSYTSYKDSNGNLNISNTEACNFAYALLTKYVNYFAGKGCKYFHFGADESKHTGDDMTAFLTNCAKIISTKTNSKGEKMVPRAFNDATKDATMPQSVQITYWHKETNSKAASELADSGYSLINTHGRWYYVIKNDQGTSEQNKKYWNGTVNSAATSVELPTYKLNNDQKTGTAWVGINQFFDGNSDSISAGSTVSSSLGTMFCIWCDASQNNYLTSDQVISENQNYGALYQLQQLAEHYWPDDIDAGGTDPVDPTEPTTVNVNLKVGESTTFEVDSSVDAGSYVTDSNAFIATAEVAHVEGVSETTVSTTKATTVEDGASYIVRYAGSNYALTSNTGRTDWGTKTLAFETYTAAEEDNVWKLEASGTGYKLKSAAGYLMLGYNAAYTDTAGEVFTITLDNNSWKVMDTDNYCIDALGGLTNYYSAGGWKESGTRFDLYKVTEATEETSTLTITGTGENVKDDQPLSVTVGNTTYNIRVTAPNTQETLTLGHGETKKFNGSVEIVKNEDNCVTLSGNTITAGTTDGQATIKVTEKNTGNRVTAYTTYTVTVSDIDFSTISDLEVQLWITNTYVGSTNPVPTDKVQTVSISAEEAYSAEGIALSSKVPSPAYKRDGGDIQVIFWKGTVLHDGKTQASQGDDMTNAGDDFATIRYWENTWQYRDSTGWKEFDLSDNKDTVIAYYLQKFDITDGTDEIYTATQHYGNGPKGDYGSGGSAWDAYYTLTTFALVYPWGSTSPATEAAIYDKGMLRGYTPSTNDGGTEGNQSLGVIYAENNTDYVISKITYTWGKNQQNNYWPKSANSGGVTWDKTTNAAGEEVYDETVVWSADDPEKYGEIPMMDANKEGIYFTGGDQACMIRIYLKAVPKETNLNVVYWDDTANEQINREEMQIVADSAATFTYSLQPAAPKKTGEIELSDDAYIENKSGKPEHLNKYLPTVTGGNIPARYKSGVYKYVKAVISEDGKTLTLHYVLDTTRLKATYVVDFGLPLDIPLNDLLANAETVEGIYANEKNITDTSYSTEHGTLKYDSKNHKIVYTMNKPFDSDEMLTANFRVKYSKEDGLSKAITIGVLPASNVLYEENFLTAETTGSSIAWQQVSTNTIKTAQETQKVGETGKNVFGYDGAYVGTEEEPVKGQLGVWSVKDLEAGKGLSSALTTEFYGNGFDLIGDCGPDTGRVFLFIEGADKVLITDIDTRYKDSTLSQVPLAHVMLEQEANYKVTIYAAGLAGETTSTPTSTNGVAASGGIATYAAAMPVLSYDADLYSALAEMGLTMSDVEYVNVSAAQSTAVPAVRRAAAASTNGIATYAATDDTTTVKHDAGTHVEIDGFRVYRSSTNNTNYPEAEQNVTYANVLDKVTFNNEKCAYTELDANHTLVTREDYETTYGGPQNEIYLTNGQSVVFNLGTAMAGQTIQISARAVTGEANLNNAQPISSNTEMYYEVQVGENGTLAIQNYGSGMLAIANLKVPENTNFQTVTDETLAIAEQMLLAYAAAPVDPEPEQPTVFAPEQLDASVSTARFFRNKLITLTVKASADVAKLTVNGKELRPTNSWLVQKGWSDTYTYVLTDTVKKNESRTYEIVAYDASGLASETKTLRAD